MKKLYFNSVFLFMMNLTGTSAQKGQDTAFHLLLKFHPLPLINFDRPSIQGSFEASYKNWGGEFTYGKRYRDYGLIEDKDPDTLLVKFNGENFRFDLKRYNLLHRSRKIYWRNYVGLSFWHIHDQFNAFHDYRQDSVTWVEDNYAVKRIVHVFAIQYGWIISRHGFGVEGYVSLGVRKRTQTLIGHEFEPNDFQTNFLYRDSVYRPFKGYSPHTNLCIKLFYDLYYWRYRQKVDLLYE